MFFLGPCSKGYVGDFLRKAYLKPPPGVVVPALDGVDPQIPSSFDPPVKQNQGSVPHVVAAEKPLEASPEQSSGTSSPGSGHVANFLNGRP